MAPNAEVMVGEVLTVVLVENLKNTLFISTHAMIHISKHKPKLTDK